MPAIILSNPANPGHPVLPLPLLFSSRLV